MQHQPEHGRTDYFPRPARIRWWGHHRAPTSVENLAKRLRVPADKIAPVIEQLTQNGLISTASRADGQAAGEIQLTNAGQQTLDKLCAAYHDSLAELLDGWLPEEEEELARLLRRLATRLLSEDSSRELVSTPG